MARLKLPSAIQLKVADVHHLPFSSNSFDSVLSTEAFHHYESQSKALQEMIRVTKKGGKVIVVDINFFFKPIHWLFQRVEPGCVKINNKREIKNLFENNGLTKVHQQRSFMFAVITVGIKS